jgi:virginiamycin B lyase
MFSRQGVRGVGSTLQARRRPLAVVIVFMLLASLAAAVVHGDQSSARHIAAAGEPPPGTPDSSGAGQVDAVGAPSSTNTQADSGSSDPSSRSTSTSSPATGSGEGTTIPPGGMPPGPTVPPVVPDKRITEFPVGNLEPFGLVAGPDGNLWFTDGSASHTTPGTANDIVGRMTLDGDVHVFHTPTAESGPGPIIVGPDGAMWFTEQRANAIGRITTAGQITEYPLITPNANPAWLVVGPDGAIWFTEPTAGKIGHVTTTGQLDEVWVPADGPPPMPYDIVSAYGALWFTDGRGNIERASVDGKFTRFPIADHPVLGVVLTSGPDGGLWYESEWNTATPTPPIDYIGHHTIGRMAADGTVSQIELPDDGRIANRMTAGPDGNFWVTESVWNRVLRVTPAGNVTEFAANRPLNIAPGPDHNVWFAAPDAHTIGRIKL